MAIRIPRISSPTSVSRLPGPEKSDGRIRVRIRTARRLLAPVAHLQALRREDQRAGRGPRIADVSRTQARLRRGGHEIVSHGWRWLDYHEMEDDEERQHIKLAVAGIEELTGAPPVGWFSGRPSVNTRRLFVEQGGFLYDRHYLGYELPFWVKSGDRDHLVIAYSLET